jgi:peroxiredoxin Q/BCP
MKWLLLFGLFAALSLLVIRMARAGELPGIGAAAPVFELPDQHGVTHGLQQYAGKWLVLYFYPRDDTPGCTQEACAFRDDLHKLTAMGAVVIGISVDDSASHAAFAEKYHLPFPLLADQSGEVAARYGALLDMVVFKVARRYTYLIDAQGRIVRVYTKVETSRHSTEVIEDLKTMIEKGK